LGGRSIAHTQWLDNQILKLVVKGTPTKEIASELGISLRVAQQHISKIMWKIKEELLKARQDDILSEIYIAKSRFLEDKMQLRRVLDDPNASHREVTEAVRTDAELNLSLLKISVEGVMFTKYALQADGLDRDVNRQTDLLRLDQRDESTRPDLLYKKPSGPTDGVS